MATSYPRSSSEDDRLVDQLSKVPSKYEAVKEIPSTPEDTRVNPQADQGSTQAPIGIEPITQKNLKGIRARELDGTAPDKRTFPNRALKYLGKDRAWLEESKAHKVAKCAETFAKELLDKIAKKDSLFVGTVLRCGSYYEGVKVRWPNELDYIYELSAEELRNIEPKHETPKTFKPYKSESIRAKSYYKLAFKPPVPLSCEKYICESLHGELDPRKLQTEFMNLVQSTAKSNMEKEEQSTVNNDVKEEVQPTAESDLQTAVQCNGPAVTLYCQLKPEFIKEHLNEKWENFLIKIKTLCRRTKD